MMPGSPGATLQAHHQFIGDLRHLAERDGDRLGCLTELEAVQPPEPLSAPARWE
jgi:hypothetical protein